MLIKFNCIFVHYTQSSLMRKIFVYSAIKPYTVCSVCLYVCVCVSGIFKVLVSSGGMYLAKLDPDDLNLERMRNFSGSQSYSQQKVRTYTHTHSIGCGHTMQCV